MKLSARERFVSYVRHPEDPYKFVSPFLPHPDVIRNTLIYLDLPVADDEIRNEIVLSQYLNYIPMFMTDLPGLIFKWQVDGSRSDEDFEFVFINTAKGKWIHKFPRNGSADVWNDSTPRPVQTAKDHEFLVCVCEQIQEREDEIRQYYRNWRQVVGEHGVIVIGHPHPAWLGSQISPEAIFYHWTDFQTDYIKSMNAIYQASLFIMTIAIDEGIDFMSDSSYGLEMTSPNLFKTMDLPYIQAFANWTHEQNGLFWYHNCGFTRELIVDGTFNTLGADVIETIAPPPEGDNDLVESRRHLNSSICTKGNLNLNLLRDGNPDQIADETRKIINAVKGFPHIISTADGVLQGTPPENFISFINTANECLEC